MEGAGSSETLVSYLITTRSHNPEDNLNLVLHYHPTMGFKMEVPAYAPPPQSKMWIPVFTQARRRGSYLEEVKLCSPLSQKLQDKFPPKLKPSTC